MNEFVRFSEKQIERFWKKIDIKGEEECWNWKNSKDANGYAEHRLDQKGKTYYFSVPRLALKFSGIDVDEGLLALHTCGNRACCNPKHLKAGTRKENMNQNKPVEIDPFPSDVKFQRSIDLTKWCKKATINENYELEDD